MHRLVVDHASSASPTHPSTRVALESAPVTQAGAGHMATARVSAYARGSHALTRRAFVSAGLLTTGTPGRRLM